MKQYAIIRETRAWEGQREVARLEVVGVDASGAVKHLGVDFLLVDPAADTPLTGGVRPDPRTDALDVLMDSARGLRLLPFDSDELDDVLGIRRDRYGRVRLRRG